MVLELVLPASKKQGLSLEVVNDLNWCQVYLLSDNDKVALGADTLEVVVNKLSSILDREAFPDTTDEIENEEWVMFMTLFEEHTWGYARLIASGILIRFNYTTAHY